MNESSALQKKGNPAGVHAQVSYA
jgi:hypothetical protein